MSEQYPITDKALEAFKTKFCRRAEEEFERSPGTPFYETRKKFKTRIFESIINKIREHKELIGDMENAAAVASHVYKGLCAQYPFLTSMAVQAPSLAREIPFIENNMSVRVETAACKLLNEAACSIKEEKGPSPAPAEARSLGIKLPNF